MLTISIHWPLSDLINLFLFLLFIFTQNYVNLKIYQLFVGAATNLVYHRRLQVDEERAWHIFSRACLAKESTKRIVRVLVGFVDHAIWLNVMLETKELPTRVAYLSARLANMNVNYFSLLFYFIREKKKQFYYMNLQWSFSFKYLFLFRSLRSCPISSALGLNCSPYPI